MQSITIDRHYRGPPASANGGYVCGLVANAMGGSGESDAVRARAPWPASRNRASHLADRGQVLLGRAGTD